MQDELFVEDTEPNNITLEYPALVERLQSMFIDMMLIIICMGIFSAVLDKIGAVPDWVRPTLFISLSLVYEPFCICYGCTLGNYLKKIRVKKQNDTSKRINIFQSLLRYIIKLALGWISFLTIHSNPQRRAMHDKASGSLMIKIE